MLCATPKFNRVNLQVFISFAVHCSAGFGLWSPPSQPTMMTSKSPKAYKVIVAGPSPDDWRVSSRTWSLQQHSRDNGLRSLEFEYLNMTIIYSLPIFIGVRTYTLINKNSYFTLMCYILFWCVCKLYFPNRSNWINHTCRNSSDILRKSQKLDEISQHQSQWIEMEIEWNSAKLHVWEWQTKTVYFEVV